MFTLTAGTTEDPKDAYDTNKSNNDNNIEYSVKIYARTAIHTRSRKMSPVATRNIQQGEEHSAYGKNTVDKLVNGSEEASNTTTSLSAEQDLVLKTFRLLIADLCQQFNGGHPGCVRSNCTAKRSFD